MSSSKLQSPQAAFPQLFESFADGRLTNVYYRREQLARLRAALVQSRPDVLAAIVQDAPGTTAAEAFAELYLTLTAIKQYHDDLKPADELAAEYSIAHGHDAALLRRGVGVVSIVPQQHSLLYSVVVPLAAAIAAGNAVVLVLEKTVQALPPLLEAAIKKAVDPEIFEIATLKKVADVSGEGFVSIVQTGDATFLGRPGVLFSPADALSVAVVDRTADVDAAAKTLVDARMQFGGRSPYAPDIVLVNEFVKNDFLQAAVKHAIRYMTELGGDAKDKAKANGSAADAKASRKSLSGASQQTKAGIKTVTSGSNVSILDVVDRSALGSVGKVLAPALYVHAIRSLDDAIEAANDASGGAAAAAFAFAGAPESKYLLQFVSAQVGLANHVPKDLLVGPLGPKGQQSTSLATRYPTDLLSVPQPRYAEKTGLSRQVDTLLDPRPTAARAQEQQEALLKGLQLEPRIPTRFILGYFESAAVVGLITIATPLLTGMGFLAVFGVRKALAAAMKMKTK